MGPQETRNLSLLLLRVRPCGPRGHGRTVVHISSDAGPLRGGVEPGWGADESTTFVRKLGTSIQ
jgi:hypothetical protein